ncbi:hypothetical protein ABZU45_41845 [Streptomyces avermitilis]|uniref:hypothetical protein n=1 Tax=Streptomyces avermitilis TaxID=33903 RepID=UPI0033B1A413
MSHATWLSLEKDGWRALVSAEAGRVALRSRRGAGLVASFPEIRSGSRQLPDATALDGELIVAERMSARRDEYVGRGARLAMPRRRPREKGRAVQC